MKLSRERLQEILSRHRFTAMIGLVVVIALLMTTISLSLYVTSGTLQLDLSRPGYEAVRQEISPTSHQDFPATGPITSSTLSDFQKQYTAQRTGLDSTSKFQDSTIEDESLGTFSTSAQAQ